MMTLTASTRQDIHWYNRDKEDDADARAAELAKIKQAESDAMSLALSVYFGSYVHL